MSRRRIPIIAASLSLATLTMHVSPATGQVTAGPGRPNIVFIMTDDQRFDTVRGFMPVVESEILAKGLEFENAFASNPLCCPSRASILTGLYAHSHGVWDNKNGPHGGFAGMSDDSTIATWLDDAGYHTALIGKYQNGYDVTGGTYIPPGWDEWFALMEGNYYRYWVTDNGEPWYVPSVYSTDLFATEAETFIRHAPTDEPFFLMFNPRAPHGPYTPATRHDGALADHPPYRSPSWMEDDVGDKPRWIQELAGTAEVPVALHDRQQIDSLESLLAVDEAVARILDALEDSGRLEDTLIVFTSDNGYEWGEHRFWGKNAPYDASLRLPLIMRWDGVIGPGTSTSAVVANVDFAPTLAAVAGVTPPKPVDGRSLTRFFADPNAELGRKGILLEHTMGGKLVPPYCGWRTADELYVRWDRGEEEYYRYSIDPYELRNAASRPSMADRVAALRSLTRLRCRPSPIGMLWR